MGRLLSQPCATIWSVEAGPTLRFAAAARRLGSAARAAGLAVPAFRSPPRHGAAVRTIRRFAGGAVVAVQTRARPFDRVAADMVEGILAANDLEGPAAHRLRLALWEAAVEPDGADEASGRASWSPARVAKRQTQAA